MSKEAEDIRNRYVARLKRESRVLPKPQREDLLAEIGEHLDAILGVDPTMAQTRQALDDLGAPRDIVKAALPGGAERRRGTHELAGVILLFIPIVPIFGWLAGAFLVVTSPLWSRAQKTLALLTGPASLVLAGISTAVSRSADTCHQVTSFQDNSTMTCLSHSDWTTGASTALVVVVLLLGPVAVGAYLYAAAGRKVAVSG